MNKPFKPFIIRKIKLWIERYELLTKQRLDIQSQLYSMSNENIIYASQLQMQLLMNQEEIHEVIKELNLFRKEHVKHKLDRLSDSERSQFIAQHYPDLKFNNLSANDLLKIAVKREGIPFLIHAINYLIHDDPVIAVYSFENKKPSNEI